MAKKNYLKKKVISLNEIHEKGANVDRETKFIIKSLKDRNNNEK